jgi:hypothetical protein
MRNLVKSMQKLLRVSPRSSVGAGASKTATFQLLTNSCLGDRVMSLGRPYLSLSTKNHPFCMSTHKEACTKLAHNQRDSHTRSGNEKMHTKMGAPWAQGSRESKTSRWCGDAVTGTEKRPKPEFLAHSDWRRQLILFQLWFADSVGTGAR